VLVGVPRKGSNISIHSLPLHFGKVLSGSHGGDAEPAKDIPRYLGIYRAGRLKLGDLVSERVGLEQINAAIGRMRDGSLSGRCMIRL
jgi:S-(hydroxymethyl)glutathione dehydrogenase/alcohol dehydrogenase